MYLSLIFIVGGICVPWFRTLVFLRLKLKPKSDHTDSIVTADFGQRELRVQYHQQRADLVRSAKSRYFLPFTLLSDVQG